MAMPNSQACPYGSRDVLVMPTEPWLDRLRRDHFVWLIKEQEPAQIEFAYEPPEPGCRIGRLGIRRLHITEASWAKGAIQNWFVSAAGLGLDGKPIVAPVRGNLPDEAKPISEVWQRHVERTLGKLVHRLEQIETLLLEIV